MSKKTYRLVTRSDMDGLVCGTLLKYLNIIDEIAFVQRLEAPDLVEANENGELKGKLKEIASTLDEESNPVLMLARYKK